KGQTPWEDRPNGGFYEHYTDPSSVQPSEPRITPLLGLPDNPPAPSTSAVLDATSGASQEVKAGMPTLANPHPFLRKLGAYFGLSGPEPNPGEIYSGPTSGQDRSNALKNLISRGLNAVAYAAQPPEQARTELARQQFGPTLELEREKALAQLEEAHSLHQATN